ncbi:MAG: hypothetical protein WCF84_18550 [Anaerolineae bacterium]
MTQRRNARATSRQPTYILIGIFAGAALLLIAGLALLFTGGGNSSGSHTGPRLSVDREQIDFGRVPLDKPVHAEFKITNSGDRSLTLDASAPVQVVKGC